MRMQGKIGIVTAAASGMGRAGALRFAREGAAVGVADIDQARVEAVVAEITAAGGRALALVGDLPALSGNPGFHKAVGDVVARVNGELAPIERVRRFIIAHEPFSIDNAQITPTLKIRRHAIRAAYEAAFDALYEGKGIAA